MKSNFGHEDAATAPAETLDTIVRTFDISQFLTTNDRRYLVGPKGSGKTLMLIRKAIDQRSRGDGLCIPQGAGNPVDRLAASSHVGERFNRGLKLEDARLAWATVWKYAILCSVLHHLRDAYLGHVRERAGEADSDWGRKIAAQRLGEARAFIDALIPEDAFQPKSPFDYYTDLANRLDSGRRKDLPAITADVLKLHNLLGMLRIPVYVFLDNLDDYYESSPDLWTNSMYGQLRAIREIGLKNSNVHVFTSIRQDVYQQFKDEMTLQYFSFVAFLRYERQHLLQIFESSVKELQDDLLQVPTVKASRPWEAFFGNLATVANGRIGAAETVQDYILRHTLGRPRDVVHMGNSLLRERPLAQPYTEDIVRRAVRNARSDIAEQYLAEVRPTLDPRFSVTDFVASMPTDVIAAGELADAVVRFHETIADVPTGDTDLAMPFETLYQLGLLGFTREAEDHRDTLVQQFHPVGHGLPSHAQRALPKADWYLLHPVLHSWLPAGARRRGVAIGDGLPFNLEDA